MRFPNRSITQLGNKWRSRLFDSVEGLGLCQMEEEHTAVFAEPVWIVIHAGYSCPGYAGLRSRLTLPDSVPAVPHYLLFCLQGKAGIHLSVSCGACLPMPYLSFGCRMQGNEPPFKRMVLLVLVFTKIYGVLLRSDADCLCIVRTIYMITQGPSTVHRHLHSVPSLPTNGSGWWVIVCYGIHCVLCASSSSSSNHSYVCCCRTFAIFFELELVQS